MTEMIKVTINGEYEIILPKHRADRPEWYTEGGWEKKRLKSLLEHCSDKETLFYVGAEEGEMPALARMRGARVVMIEPNPKVWPNIKAIWDSNKLTNPICFEGFASNQSINHGNLYLNLFPPSADGEVISDHAFMELHNHNAPEIKLDDLAKDHNLIPTMISLDVEGSEWQVLRGAENVLKEYHPRIWLSLHPEFMYEQYKEYGFDLRHWIKGFGYTETLLDYQHEVHFLYE